jgi:hypothetical protein
MPDGPHFPGVKVILPLLDFTHKDPSRTQRGTFINYQSLLFTENKVKFIFLCLQ